LSIHAAARVVNGYAIRPLRMLKRGSDSYSQTRSSDHDPVRDRDWIEAIRNGDEAAFEQVFLAYFDRLQAYAERYVRRPEVAEEMVGNVFVRLWEQRDRWELRQSLKSYLYAAVRNQALMWLDHQHVVGRAREAGMRERQSPGMGQPPAAADEELQAAELAEAVNAAIGRLPNRAREAYMLNRQHGLSYAEIAEAMGISIRTVEIHVGRALKALREELATFLS
jgi:RNA polymerase sigma-70 factor (family 1)